MEEMRDQHLRSWLDEPVPMLNNLSPRSAAQTASGRARLEELLSFYEKMNSSRTGGGMPSFSMNPDRAWVYSQLGISAAMTVGQQAPQVSSRAMELCLGQPVVLDRMDDVEMNGRPGTVIGPLHEGCLVVRMEGDFSEMRVRSRNLCALKEYRERGYISGGHVPMRPPPRGQTQSSIGASYNKETSYVVAMNDFQHLPRWPADGCMRTTLAFSAGDDKYKHHELPQKCSTQRAFERQFGGWPTSRALADMDGAVRNFILGMAYHVQVACAAETFDAEAAVAHLYEHRDGREVATLLKRAIGSTKLGGRRERFPGLRLLLAALGRAGLATDRALETLFGDAARVRHLMLHVGQVLAQPPPRGSPAAAEWSDVLSKRFELLTFCSNCHEEQRQLQVCSGCKVVYYCCDECQKEHWPLHKPECLRALGEVVAPEAEATAKEAARRRTELMEAEIDKQRQILKQREDQHVAKAIAEYESGTWKALSAHDDEGKPFKPDIGTQTEALLTRCAARAGLAPEVTHLRPLFTIKGTRAPEPSNLFLLQTTGGAFILLFHVRLFDAHGERLYAGAAFDAMYVAAERGAVELDEPIEWVEVARPRGSARGSAFEATCQWLEAAKARATVVTHGIYRLGTPEVAGHTIRTQHSHGQRMVCVGPPTIGDSVHARSRALARQQLRNAKTVLEHRDDDATTPSEEARVAAEARLLSALELTRALPASQRDLDAATQAALLLGRTAGHRPSTAAVAVTALQQVAKLDGLSAAQAAQIASVLREARECVPVPQEAPRKCKCCGESKPREAFSANQWKQGKRRCLACQQGGVTTTVEQREEAAEAAEAAAAFAAIHAQRAAEEHARVQAELERRNAVERADSECPICFEEKGADERYAMHGVSNHWVCRTPCLADLVGMLAADATGVACPHCRTLCSLENMRLVLG